jgi:DNA modification methylase
MKIYQSRGIQIYQDDCYNLLNKIPSSCAIVSDPPYGINNKCDYHGRNMGNLYQCGSYAQIINDDKPFDPTPFLRFDKVALMGGNYYNLYNQGSLHVWDKTRYGVNKSDQSDCEFIWINKKMGNRVFHHLWKGLLKDSEKQLVRVHPTQKPVALMHWIILSLLKLPNEITIIDPFMGSGSTLVAASTLGYKAIGIELSEEYCKAAIVRLENEGFEKGLSK